MILLSFKFWLEWCSNSQPLDHNKNMFCPWHPDPRSSIHIPLPSCSALINVHHSHKPPVWLSSRGTTLLLDWCRVPTSDTLSTNAPSCYCVLFPQTPTMIIFQRCHTSVTPVPGPNKWHIVPLHPRLLSVILPVLVPVQKQEDSTCSPTRH